MLASQRGTSSVQATHKTNFLICARIVDDIVGISFLLLTVRNWATRDRHGFPLVAKALVNLLLLARHSWGYWTSTMGSRSVRWSGNANLVPRFYEAFNMLISVAGACIMTVSFSLSFAMLFGQQSWAQPGDPARKSTPKSNMCVTHGRGPQWHIARNPPHNNNQLVSCSSISAQPES